MHLHFNVQVNAMLQHIVSITDNACISLLYPEAQLFPRIFWKSQDSSVVGSIPSFMLNCFFNNSDNGIASLQEHNSIRMKDGDLLTSKQNTYWHYLFDLVLNQQLLRCSSSLVLKRGLEFLLEDDCGVKSGSQWRGQESHLPMDEYEATRRIKELASLLKKGSWDYFITLTINETETPGVRKITEAIRQYAEHDILNPIPLYELTEAYLPFILRSWERFISVLLQELIMRNDNIIGKVHNMFYRYEFQEAGAKGNKPHVHIGVTLEPEPKHISSGRISCMSASFASTMYGTDYHTLRDLGVVADRHEYEVWLNIFSHVNTHDCDKCGQRCKKAINAEGEKICRYHKQPIAPYNVFGDWLADIPVPYPEEIYILLEEMGLATKNSDCRSNGWTLHECLATSKWHYRAHQCEYFLASIPLLSAITRSSTNVDLCSRHFQVSYLVSYLSGKEERRLVDIVPTKDINDIKTVTEEHAHEKIASCRRIVEEKEKKNPHLGREISLAEVVWFVLGFKYTYCTADFVRVSTVPLESRAATKRYNNNTTSESPAIARINAGLPEWRQFTASQIAHIEEYNKSSYYIDATSAFNLRPPELLVFDDLQLYNECFVAERSTKCTNKSRHSCRTMDRWCWSCYQNLCHVQLINVSLSFAINGC